MRVAEVRERWSIEKTDARRIWRGFGLAASVNQFFIEVKHLLITTCADERFLGIDASGIRSLCPNLYLYES